jgi:peptidoglycan/LPS O-acetylase OafA/YrhL
LLHRILDRTPRLTSLPTAFGILRSPTWMEWALIAWVTGIATLVDPQALFVLPLIFVIFVLIQSRSLLIAPLRWSGLLYVGTISYPLYLVHQNLGYALIYHGYLIGWHPLFSIGLAITSSFLLAALLHRSVEVPGVAFGKQAFEGARGPDYPRNSSLSQSPHRNSNPTF